jgi:hypothetical protein
MSLRTSPRNLPCQSPAGTGSCFDLITEGAQERDEARDGPTEQEEIMTKELWLRVHDDGREECYDHDPAPIQALRVVVTDGVEETWTSDREVRSGWQEPVPPPGKGLGGGRRQRRQHIVASRHRRR